MEIVVGTYEELILGYKVISSEEGYELEASFTDHSHTGCVKTVAVSRKGILASGSSDETIRLINLRNRKELGSLIQHEGSVTRVVFHSAGSHMFSSSEDGTVCVWKTGSWECSRVLRGHKSPIYDVTIHPSGKLALSISKDKNVRTWNLMTARLAFTKLIKQVADMIMWSPDGVSYLVVVGNRIDVYNVETAGVELTIQCEFIIHAAAFINDNLLAIGGEEGHIIIHDLKSKSSVHKFSTDTNRVKGISVCKCPEDQDIMWLITVSSDGFIKVWKVENTESKFTCSLVTEVNTKFRLTSIAVWHPGKSEDDKQTTGKITTPQKLEGEKQKPHTGKVTKTHQQVDVEKTKKRKKPQDQSRQEISTKKIKVTIDSGKKKHKQKKKQKELST